LRNLRRVQISARRSAKRRVGISRHDLTPTRKDADRMRIKLTIAVAVIAGLVAVPSLAPASIPSAAGGKFAKYCKDQSKRHAKGKKSSFGLCVTAMRRLSSGAVKSPRVACKRLSKKHVKGRKGTPFSRCVRGGRRLRADDQQYADPFGP
jgi:hypothetical protein